jgi:signal transduction histidine kinase
MYTILIIEDDQLVRNGLVVFLKNSGKYTILQAEDGQEGLEIFRRTSPDLVLTDLRLPKRDGLEVLAVVKHEAPDTPVIIVSGMGTLNDAIKALTLGACDYITTPIPDMVLLKYAVERALERKSLISENKRYQKYLEEEVKKKTAELQQAQKMEAIGTMAGGIAHEFNNILAAIMGYADLVLLKTDQDEDVAESVRQIKKASNRAKDLVLQILAYSRKSTIQRYPVQAAVIIKETLMLLRATLPTTVELKQHIDERNTMINIDPTELHQVITNLCTNAFHALPDEKGIISVRLDTHTFREKQREDIPGLKAGEYLELVVQDNGCGMDKETAGKIFNPFFTTKGKGYGSGLGLSVVHGIVKSSNGFISVKSAPETGTAFSVLFPAVNTVVVEEGPVAVSPPGGSEHILFVDDEEALQNLAELMFSYLGYSVSSCSSGEDALQVLKNNGNSVDLVITDQSMPHMSGVELAEVIHTLYPGLPIILCTGYSSVVDKEKAKAMGFAGFLMKPLSINKLACEIRKVFDD